MAAINVASSQTEIRLTGSTAFRAATVNAIQHILWPGYVWGTANDPGEFYNEQIFVGTTKTLNIDELR
jgi:hypothetical protein